LSSVSVSISDVLVTLLSESLAECFQTRRRKCRREMSSVRTEPRSDNESAISPEQRRTKGGQKLCVVFTL